MTEASFITSAYEDFCVSLPSDLGVCARELSARLLLAPKDVGWTETFAHEVTLSAPRLFAEGMHVSAEAVDLAARAHLFAVIEAFTVDRAFDRQVEFSPWLLLLVGRLREACDQALRELLPRDVQPGHQAASRRGVLRAMRVEQLLLATQTTADLSTYGAISGAKQQVAFGPSDALAQVAGWSPRKRAVLLACLRSVALGMQALDDLFDWERDYCSGGAWAVALSGRSRSVETSLDPSLVTVRRAVLADGVLARMASWAAQQFSLASRQAKLLGAKRLAEWALGQAAQADEIATSERRWAGVSLRRQALGNWSMEVSGGLA